MKFKKVKYKSIKFRRNNKNTYKVENIIKQMNLKLARPGEAAVYIGEKLVIFMKKNKIIITILSLDSEVKKDMKVMIKAA